MAEINWKSKYTELKAKYMNAVDAAFRIGMEQGMQQAQMQQMQDQAAQEQAAAQGAQPGQPGEEGAPQEGGAMQESEHPMGSELDQHISTLEGMLKKSEITDEDLAEIKKSIANIKFAADMRKSDAAVKSIAKSLAPKSLTMSATAQHNLAPAAKAAVSGQAKIVADIMSQWESQEADLSRSIIDIVAGEGLKKD